MAGLIAGAGITTSTKNARAAQLPGLPKE